MYVSLKPICSEVITSDSSDAGLVLVGLSSCPIDLSALLVLASSHEKEQSVYFLFMLAFTLIETSLPR